MEEETSEGHILQKNFKYAGDFDSRAGSFFLLQVPSGILEELQNKQTMSLISREGSDVCKLVSKSDTFKVKKFDYPNSFVLTEKIANDYEIRASVKSLYQLEKQPNQMDRLYKHLLANQIIEKDFEDSSNQSENGNLLHLNLNSAQAEARKQQIGLLMNDYFISHCNLLQFMKEISAIVKDDCVYFLEFEIYLKVFRELLSYLSLPGENSTLSYQHISLDQLVQLFPLVSKEILQMALQIFTEFNETAQAYQISYKHLCKFIMIELSLAKKDYHMDEFLDFFSKMAAVYVPESIDQTLSAAEKQLVNAKLRNKYFMILDSNQYNLPTPTYLSQVRLIVEDPYLSSFEPKERVAYLFDRKKNYFPTEFRDFLEVLKLNKKDEDDLVIGNCRSISISIHKKHKELFSSLYPAETLNPDKLSPDNFSCKVYTYKKK